MLVQSSEPKTYRVYFNKVDCDKSKAWIIDEGLRKNPEQRNKSINEQYFEGVDIRTGSSSVFCNLFRSPNPKAWFQVFGYLRISQDKRYAFIVEKKEYESFVASNSYNGSVKRG